jgi:hypothetical protein
MTEASEPDVERLYGLPLDEFTSARDDTARRLRDEGRREDAAAVKALSKPSNPAWIVNKLSRDASRIIDDLIDAGRRLRDTQLSGNRSKLQDAMECERAAVDRAMRNAEEIATHAGLATTPTLQRVRETLHLAALDPDVAVDLKRGVITREGRAAGFTGLSGFAAPVMPREPATAKTKRDTTAERRDGRGKQRLAQAQEKAAAAERDLRDAKRELADAGRALAAATREHERAQTRVERAQTRRDTAKARVAELEHG